MLIPWLHYLFSKGGIYSATSAHLVMEGEMLLAGKMDTCKEAVVSLWCPCCCSSEHIPPTERCHFNKISFINVSPISGHNTMADLCLQLIYDIIV